MVELADRRKIADLDESHRQRPRYEEREELRDHRQSRSEDREELLDRRPSRFEPQSLPHDTRRPLHEVRQLDRDDRSRLHNTGVWRGDEYLPPNERQQPVDTRRRRRVSFADDRQYYEVRGLHSHGICAPTDLSRMIAVKKMCDGAET